MIPLSILLLTFYSFLKEKLHYFHKAKFKNHSCTYSHLRKGFLATGQYCWCPHFTDEKTAVCNLCNTTKVELVFE